MARIEVGALLPPIADRVTNFVHSDSEAQDWLRHEAFPILGQVIAGNLTAQVNVAYTEHAALGFIFAVVGARPAGAPGLKHVVMMAAPVEPSSEVSPEEAGRANLLLIAETERRTAHWEDHTFVEWFDPSDEFSGLLAERSWQPLRHSWAIHLFD